MAKNNKEKDSKVDFYFCRNRKCTHDDCLRFFRYAPWNVPFQERMCVVNEKGECKDYVKE